ncbi:MAG TPA: hypothetical protein VHZ25_17930 [Acidobacteriaceae bacterium]|jgi:hypothetical protein|nr:hypothetical protein [Acidobacteriaceae bacterium]
MQPQSYKPLVRWSYSALLEAWIVSAKGKAEVAVAFRTYGPAKKLTEAEIIERLFAWPVTMTSRPFPRGEGVPSRLQPRLQEVG